MDREDQQAIEFTYSGGDIAVLNLLTWRYWAIFIAIIAVLICSLSIGVLLFDGLGFREAILTTDWVFMGKLILVLVAWLVVVTLVSNFWRARQESKGRIVLSLTDQGVKVRSRRMDGLIFWSAIKSIKVRAGRVFFFMTYRMAIIVPRRAFKGDADFNAFARTACREWEEARAK